MTSYEGSFSNCKNFTLGDLVLPRIEKIVVVVPGGRVIAMTHAASVSGFCKTYSDARIEFLEGNWCSRVGCDDYVSFEVFLRD